MTPDDGLATCEVTPGAPGAVPNRVLIVPRSILAATHDFLLPYWRAEVETACFWAGIDGDEHQVVTTLAMPRLIQARRHYQLDLRSVRDLAADLEAQDLTNLAQVHTHPGDLVGHSPYDDEHAYSTAAGALSLVWPRYGYALHHDLTGIGVHERREGYWVQLTPTEVAQRIRLVDSQIDRRWGIAMLGDGGLAGGGS